eukprot:403333076
MIAFQLEPRPQVNQIGIDNSDLMDRYGITSLKNLTPDLWKNIPFPVIQAIKQLIDVNLNIFTKLTDQDKQFMLLQKKSQTQFSKLEKQIGLQEQNNNNNNDTLKSVVTVNINKMNNEIESAMNRSKSRQQEVMEEIRKLGEDIHDNHDKLKNWAIGYVENKKQDVIQYADKCNLTLTNQMRDIFENHLSIPNLIGKDEQYKTFSEYLLGSKKHQDLIMDDFKRSQQKLQEEHQTLKTYFEAQIETNLPNRFKQMAERINQFGDIIKQISGKQLPNLETTLDDINTDHQKKLIETKVKQELIESQISHINSELDKLTARLSMTRDELDMKKRESIIYTQDMTKQIKDALNKQIEHQKEDLADKVKSLNFLIEKSEKRLAQNQEIIREKIEEISGQKVHLSGFESSRNHIKKENPDEHEFKIDDDNDIKKDHQDNRDIDNDQDKKELTDEVNVPLEQHEEQQQLQNNNDNQLDEQTQETNNSKSRISQLSAGKNQTGSQSKMSKHSMLIQDDQQEQQQPGKNVKFVNGVNQTVSQYDAHINEQVQQQIQKLQQKTDMLQLTFLELNKFLSTLVQANQYSSNIETYKQQLSTITQILSQLNLEDTYAQQLHQQLQQQQQREQRDKSINLRLASFDQYFKKLFGSNERNNSITDNGLSGLQTTKVGQQQYQSFSPFTNNKLNKSPSQNEYSRNINISTNQNQSQINQISNFSQIMNTSDDLQNQEYTEGNQQSNSKLSVKKQQKVQFRSFNRSQEPQTTKVNDLKSNLYLRNILDFQGGSPNQDSKDTFKLQNSNQEMQTLNMVSSRNLADNILQYNTQKPNSRTSSQRNNRSQLEKLPQLINQIDIQRTENQNAALLMQNQELKVQKIQQARDMYFDQKSALNQTISYSKQSQQPLEVKYEELESLDKISPKRKKLKIQSTQQQQ